MAQFNLNGSGGSAYVTGSGPHTFNFNAGAQVGIVVTNHSNTALEVAPVIQADVFIEEILPTGGHSRDSAFVSHSIHVAGEQPRFYLDGGESIVMNVENTGAVTRTMTFNNTVTTNHAAAGAVGGFVVVTERTGQFETPS